MTHGLAALMTVVLGWELVTAAALQSGPLAVACLTYVASAFATFTFSTLSHLILRQPLLNRLRAWDQAMIYAMISGTYTPIIVRYAGDVRASLLIAIWVVAISGIGAKLFLRHRINNVATVSYLLLGWLPAVPLYGQVPPELGWGMLLGGVLYSLGVIVLINDERFKFLHMIWHLLVMSAALCHFAVIRWYVVG